MVQEDSGHSICFSRGAICVTHLSKHESRMDSIENLSPEFLQSLICLSICRLSSQKVCLSNFLSLFLCLYFFLVESSNRGAFPREVSKLGIFCSHHFLCNIAIIITLSPPPSPSRISSQHLSRNKCNIPNSCVSIFLSPVLCSIPACSFRLSLSLLHYEFYFYLINTYKTIRNSTQP